MSNPVQTFVVMFLGLWCILLTIAGCHQERVIFSQVRVISLQSSNIEQLNRIVEKQGAMIDWHGRRITQLERPDEPVFPPRHPGRIGSIESSPDQ